MATICASVHLACPRRADGSHSLSYSHTTLLTSIWACIPYEFTYTTSYSFLNLHKDTICDLEKRNATRHDNETTATLASCSAKLKR